jgi:hypothetical protein
LREAFSKLEEEKQQALTLLNVCDADIKEHLKIEVNPLNHLYTIVGYEFIYWKES